MEPTWSRVRDELYEVAQTAHGLPSRPDWTFDTGRGKMIFWVMPNQTKTSLCPLTKIQNQRERDLARKVARQKEIKSWWSQNSKNLQLSKCKKWDLSERCRHEERPRLGSGLRLPCAQYCNMMISLAINNLWDLPKCTKEGGKVCGMGGAQCTLSPESSS